MGSWVTKNTGDTWTATEQNLVSNEIENAETAGSETPSAGSTDQLGKAITNIASNADYYTDSGAANAYVLSSISPNKSPSSYRVGMEIRWRTSNANTGSSTVNVATLGIKNIKREDGSTNPFAGEISDKRINEAIYDGTNFRLKNPTNNPCFSAYLSGDQTPTSGVVTVVQFDTENYDIGGYYDSSTNYRFTPLIPGKYHFTANLHFVSDVNFAADLNIAKNGTNVYRESTVTINSGQVGLSMNATIELNGSTDYVDIRGLILSGGTIHFESDFSQFSAFRLID